MNATRDKSTFDRRTLMLGALAAMAPLGCRSEGKPLPKLSQVPSFSLVNEEGKPFTDQDLKGEVWAAAFVFTRCPTVCPRIMKRLAEMQSTIKAKNIEMKLVCFSVDPEFDTPKVLKAFGQRYGADFSRWYLLTGDSSTIQKTVTEGFKMGLEGSIDDKKEHLGITHGSHLVLVDQELWIRGYYRSSDEPKTRELLLNAARLAEA